MAWGSVRSESRMRSCAACLKPGSSPSGPPITIATSSASSCQFLSLDASATVVTAVGLRDAVGGSADGVRVLALLTVLAAWLAIVLVAERRIVDLVNRGHLQAGRFPAVMAGAVLLLAVGGLAASQLWF